METPLEFMYRRYMVDLEFLTPIAGGVPMTRGLAASHVQRFANRVSNDLKLSMKNMGEVTEAAMEKYMLSCSSGFPLDEDGIHIMGFQVNAMLKDAAQRTKATLKRKGLGNTIRDGGLLFPLKIYLGVEPTIVEKPVKPDPAPANIKIFQTAAGVKLHIPCALLENGDLPDEEYRQLWVVVQGIGLGASRHLGYGRFEVVEIKQEGDWNVAELFRNGHPNGTRGMSPVPTRAEAVVAVAR